MPKLTKRIGIILGIVLIFALGFLAGAGYSTSFHVNHFRKGHALDVYEQIVILTRLREGRPEGAIKGMDRLISGGLRSTTFGPIGLPEEVSQWSKPILMCWQKAKEYYEEYPASLEAQSRNYRVEMELLEKVPDSQRRIQEKEFTGRYMGRIPPVLSISKWFGQPTTLEQLQGEVVLLDFWGAWCDPCLKQLPHTQELYEKYSNIGLEVIGIHSLRDSATASEFLSKNNYTFLLGIDTGETATNYSITGWPTYYLIDKQGRLVWGPKHSPPSEEQIESLLKD